MKIKSILLGSFFALFLSSNSSFAASNVSAKSLAESCKGFNISMQCNLYFSGYIDGIIAGNFFEVQNKFNLTPLMLSRAFVNYMQNNPVENHKLNANLVMGRVLIASGEGVVREKYAKLTKA